MIWGGGGKDKCWWKVSYLPMQIRDYNFYFYKTLAGAKWENFRRAGFGWWRRAAKFSSGEGEVEPTSGIIWSS